MSAPQLCIAVVSLHTSPVDRPGSGDAGGMNVVELAQAHTLAELGHRVEIVTRRSNTSAPVVQEIAPGLTLRHLDVGPPEPVAKSAQEAFIDEFSAALRALAAAAPAPGWDVLYSQHWMSGMAALPVARALGLPHVQAFHSIAAPIGAPLSAGEQAESPGRLVGEARLAAESDLVLAISDAEARAVVERGATADRVVVVRPGVDHDLFRPPLPAEDAWRPDGDAARGHVVFAGRLQPLKAPDLAIEALARVPKSVRPQLIIVGEGSQDFPSYPAELRDLAVRSGVGDRVQFTGALDRADFARVVRSAELMLVPSHSETFGLVALEAAASGVPTVATPAGGLAEVVVDGASGVLLTSREPAEWGAAITALLTDRSGRERMARTARSHARSFDWRQSGRQVETALRSSVSPSVRMSA